MKKLPAGILIVDDDLDILVSARIFLKQHFQQVSICQDPKELHGIISQGETDIIMLDMNYRKGTNDGKEGLYWLKFLQETDPTLIVVLMTAYGDVELAVESLKSGATDFILKPWNNEKLLATLSAAWKLRSASKKLQKAEQVQESLQNDLLGPPTPLSNGHNVAMSEVMNTIRKAAPTDANFLILGENGTGKQVTAMEIHRLSVRAREVFIHVDLGALHANLFESELFGHAKGAFTDAREDKPGRFELAEGGTLFLDEIGNLPLHLQSKLLHALQNRTISRVGENRMRQVNIRLICATNMPLYEMVREGTFREDLLFRINTVELTLPPLRERTEDIQALADQFLRQFNTKYRKTLGLRKDARDALLRYPWPGNIRELQHVIERAVIMAEGEEIQESDLHLSSRKAEVPAATGPAAAMDLSSMEQQLIKSALEKHKGNISKAASELGLTRAALYRRMEKFGL
ncbi:sigma-54-dependent transcriptional regulator [Dinghuibacter silviterrae]|uniref:DNA-binding NtrC family response regulator n=1 Tax=Dinghuibacter silviterrae TaxID=1539049 RepID=A0A4R8DNT9_9BACT|nr:sigma-54 dependent transcriptional regulator [Dinghuibacter silviterrae]TDW99711.1 DNA-binding NtrC family response regulator [Dinghuibacter silviterrae]